MCGIYGVVRWHGSVEGSTLAAMDAALAHRGPDDSGTLLDGPCALGMRRLSIIDLAGGRQPIASEDRAVWVVMNGEIYNHRALRRGLVDAGHRFASECDTEVLVHLYEEHGERFVDSLRGMFAAAVWDRRTRTLTLARDRLGIKPLYYMLLDGGDGGIAFASEARALLAVPEAPRAIDPTALSHYLSFGTTPADRGLLRDVRKLEPGHVLRVEEGRVHSPRRYWHLRFPTLEPALSEAEAEEHLRALLVDAVRAHLESDVPVGAFLSGGLDSSTVVALMAREGHRPHTFSVGFDERDFDELRYARLVADRFGTRHDELVVRPDVWSLVEDVVRDLDEPLADVSAIPTWLVSRRAARRVKVVLSGDGGDEVFGGYPRYGQELREARRLDRLPGSVRRGLGAVSRWLPDRARGRRWLRHASLAPHLRYVDEQSLFPSDLKARLVTADLARALAAVADPVEERVALHAHAPRDPLARLLYLDTHTYLPLDILTKVDRMSMAHSLEVRPPLLDTPLVEAMAAMPSRWKVDGAEHKRLFRRAVRPWLPPEILAREKRGFGVPIRAWFRGPLRAGVRELLLERRTVERGLFDPAGVRAVLDEHESGRRDQSLQLWSLLVLELWTRAVLDRGAAPAERTVEVRHG